MLLGRHRGLPLSIDHAVNFRDSISVVGGDHEHHPNHILAFRRVTIDLGDFSRGSLIFSV